MGRLGVSTEEALGLRATRASTTLPQTAAAAIFNVVGGRVALISIAGECTVVLGSPGNMKLISNPTVGDSVDLCTEVGIDEDAVGTLYGISGTFADAVKKSAGALSGQDTPVIVPMGTIELNLTSSGTGEVKWSIIYIPLEVDSAVTAA